MMTKRRTSYVDICPVCGRHKECGDEDCPECGWPMGRDWETVEVDLDSEVILRTIIPAQTEAA